MDTNTTTARLYQLADVAHRTLPEACANRITKAMAIVEAGNVYRNGNGYSVISQSNADVAYYVSDAVGCNCPDAQRAPIYNGKPSCKHQIAVWLATRIETLAPEPEPQPVAIPDPFNRRNRPHRLY